MKLWGSFSHNIFTIQVKKVINSLDYVLPREILDVFSLMTSVLSMKEIK